jgi:LmbE family N-acetylglucosaminyl deacetylase
MLDVSEIERVLVVTAHPDDVDFGAAGTVARLTDAGVEVTYCLVTDGQAGGFERSIPRAEMAAIRREEQTKAAAEVGVSDRHFLGYLEVSLQLRHDISVVIRTVRPQAVITHSPVRDLASTYRSHPDHVATAEAAMCAVYPDARNPFAFRDTECAALEPWATEEVWITMADDEAVAVDITDQLDRKIRALMCHRSQLQDPAAMEERVREWWRGLATLHGLPEGASAEVFRVVDTR